MAEIPGCEGYSVTEDGRVFSGERELKLYPNVRNGYVSTEVQVSGKRKRYYVHRLVALAFIPNPENKSDVNHKDGNKSNNHVDNLEWMTRSENHAHAYATGIRVRTDRSLTEEQVVFIKANQGKVTAKSIGELFSISPWTVHNVWQGRTYKEVI